MIGSEKFKMVKELSNLGMNMSQISKKMRMDYRTVQRYISMKDEEYESTCERRYQELSITVIAY